jgi:hypothetical protein
MYRGVSSRGQPTALFVCPADTTHRPAQIIDKLLSLSIALDFIGCAQNGGWMVSGHDRRSAICPGRRIKELAPLAHNSKLVPQEGLRSRCPETHDDLRFDDKNLSV